MTNRSPMREELQTDESAPSVRPAGPVFVFPPPTALETLHLETLALIQQMAEAETRPVNVWGLTTGLRVIARNPPLPDLCGTITAIEQCPACGGTVYRLDDLPGHFTAEQLESVA